MDEVSKGERIVNRILSKAKEQRRVLRRKYRHGNSPAKLPSLMDRNRYRCDEDDYESVTEYGFLPEKYFGRTISDWCDEAIDEWINDNMRLTICSPYDCTGKEFTRWITWHRNPCGRISFVHRLGLDV